MLKEKLEFTEEKAVYFLESENEKFGPFDEVQNSFNGFITKVQIENGYKFGYVDAERGEIIPPTYEGLIPEYDYQKHEIAGFIFVQNLQLGYIDRDGKQIIPAKYYSIGRVKGGFTVGQIDEELESQQKEEPLYDWEKETHINMGFCDENGQETIPCLYYAVKKVLDYYIIQKEENGKLGLFDLQGNQILPFEFEDIQPTNVVVAAKQGGQYGLYSPEGELLLPCEYKSIKNYGQDYELTKPDGSKQYCDKTGKIIEDIERE